MTLQTHQLNHSVNLESVLKNNTSVFDGSDMGLGKTYVGCYLAKVQNLKLIVICDKTIQTKWKDVASQFGIEIVNIFTYEALRGIEKKGEIKFSHGYLRSESIDDGNKSGYSIHHSSNLTELLDNLNGAGTVFNINPEEKSRDRKDEDIIHTGSINNFNINPEEKSRDRKDEEVIPSGVLFVFDETQKLKNISSRQFLASVAIVKHVDELRINLGYKSRCLFLSASFSDRIKSISGFLRLLGIMKSDKLYDIPSGLNPLMFRGTGMNVNPTGYCDVLDKTLEILDGHPECMEFRNMLNIPPKKIKDLEKRIISMWEMLKTRFIFEMIKPNTEFKHHISNEFFPIPRDEGLLVRSALSKLIEGLRKENDEYRFKEGSMGIVTKALILLQKSKVPLILRISKQVLDTDSRKKVVIFGNYNEVLESLCEGLMSYGVVLLTGDVKSDVRDDIISLFQQDNNVCRIIVANTGVGGVGIDLDDKTGNHPRVTFIYPDFRLIGIYQALGRVFRGIFTKSDAYTYFVHTVCEDLSIDLKEEERILNNLKSKMQVLNIISLTDKSVNAPNLK